MRVLFPSSRTGDISAAPLRDIARQNCVQINKPVKSDYLAQVIRDLLEPAPSRHPHTRRPGELEMPGGSENPIVYIIDDDSHLCDEYRNVLEEDGLSVESFPTAEAFLDAYRPGREACLLVDACLPGMGGLDVDRKSTRLNYSH